MKLHSDKRKWRLLSPKLLRLPSVPTSGCAAPRLHHSQTLRDSMDAVLNPVSVHKEKFLVGVDPRLWAISGKMSGRHIKPYSVHTELIYIQHVANLSPILDHIAEFLGHVLTHQHWNLLFFTPKPFPWWYAPCRSWRKILLHSFQLHSMPFLSADTWYMKLNKTYQKKFLETLLKNC